VHIAKRFAVRRTDHPEYWDPGTRETSDHSPPYLVAAALVDGGITDRTFTPARFRDEKILALADKVTLIEDTAATRLFPGTFRVRVEIRLHSGKVLSADGENPKGHPSNPMSDDDITAKFMAQATGLLGAEDSTKLVGALWDLESVGEVGELLPLMEVTSKPETLVDS
jgi:2-methylcitrate dehydratase